MIREMLACLLAGSLVLAVVYVAHILADFFADEEKDDGKR